MKRLYEITIECPYATEREKRKIKSINEKASNAMIEEAAYKTASELFNKYLPFALQKVHSEDYKTKEEYYNALSDATAAYFKTCSYSWDFCLEEWISFGM